MYPFIAQTVPEITQIQGWLQLITSGGFAALTWYLIVYAMPARDKTFAETNKETAAAFAESKRSSAAEFAETMDRCRLTFEKTMDAQRVQCKEEMAGIAEQYERHINRLFAIKDNKA